MREAAERTRERSDEIPEYIPIWGYETPEEYFAAMEAEEEAARKQAAEEANPLERKIEGIKFTTEDGTPAVLVTRMERDEGSRDPRARAKRTWYWVKEKVLWLIGVVAASAIATLIWQMIG